MNIQSLTAFTLSNWTVRPEGNVLTHSVTSDLSLNCLKHIQQFLHTVTDINKENGIIDRFFKRLTKR